MMRDRFPEVYGLGQCSLDYIGKIKNYPPADSKCEFSGLVVQGGGPVATALTALSRWGIQCTLAGVIGDDPAGFIYGLLKGWTTDQSLDGGAWAASRVSLKLGGRAGIPPRHGWVKSGEG